ncbi:MAG: hypothetical protein IJW31_02180 [Lentisphaeria bacterium]|nr:hypothetical protein [Lentisphaeria bacterium]
MAESVNPFASKIYKKISRQVGLAIESYKLINENDRILIGLSGGKDSVILTHILHEFQRKAPIKFELEVVTFNPQFAEFNIKAIAEYAAKQNWKHTIKTLNVAEIIEEKNFSDNPCVLCSRLRRGLLYQTAEELKCNKLALGHHADDAIISFMMSYFRGQGLSSMAPNVPGDNGKLRIIRPLVLTAESWIAEFAEFFELPSGTKCKYDKFLAENGDREYFKQMLETLEKKIPNFRSNALKSMSNIQKDFLFQKT